MSKNMFKVNKKSPEVLSQQTNTCSKLQIKAIDYCFEYCGKYI